MKQAQGIILGTPAYHGSFSGVLKNAMDLMGFDEFGGKIIGLVGVSGRQVARVAYLHSSENLQEFLRLWETAPLNPGGDVSHE